MNQIDELLHTFRADVPAATPRMAEDVVARLNRSPKATRRQTLQRAALGIAGGCVALTAGVVGFRILDRSVPPTQGRPIPTWGAKVTLASGSPDRAAALFRELWKREERVGLTATAHDAGVTVTVPEAEPDDVSQVTSTFDASVVDLSLPHRRFTSVDALDAWLGTQPGERRTMWWRKVPGEDFGNRAELLAPVQSDLAGELGPAYVTSKRVLLAQSGVQLATILAGGKVLYIVVEPDQVLASTAVEKVSWMDPATSEQKLMILGDRAKVVRTALSAGHHLVLLTNDEFDPPSTTGSQWEGTIAVTHADDTFLVTPSDLHFVKRTGPGESETNSFFNGARPVGIDIAGTLSADTPTRFGTPPTNIGEPAPAAQVRALAALPDVTIKGTNSVRRLFTAQIDGEPIDLLRWKSGGLGRGNLAALGPRYVAIGRRSGRVLPHGVTAIREDPQCEFEVARLVDVCSMDLTVAGKSTTTVRTVLFGRVRGTVRSIRIVGAARPVTAFVGEDWWMSSELVVNRGRRRVVIEGRDSNGVLVARSHFDVRI